MYKTNKIYVIEGDKLVEKKEIFTPCDCHPETCTHFDGLRKHIEVVREVTGEEKINILDNLSKK